MGIEVIIIFVMFLVYIALTELRVYHKDKVHISDRDKLIKTLLEERDLKHREDADNHNVEQYYKTQLEAIKYPNKTLQEKRIHVVEEGPISSHDASFKKIDEEIDRHEKAELKKK